mgnify:CR=1 FL=1|tara:strand:- start:3300 stop:4052 length:753 start_codon:yes stop_codon:yes gene_type:complete
MKNSVLLLLALIFSVNISSHAQTVDEIIDNYFENTGGAEQWNALEGVVFYAVVNQMGMEIPIEITQLKSGNQMSVIKFQGQEIKQGVFDGEVSWSINLMNQKAEKSDDETTENVKRSIGDFPDPLLDYKSKGYSAELLGTEEIDGTECYKVKLTKTPVLADGEEVENVDFYFFDMDNFVPIAQQSEIKSGPMKGQMSEVKFSDYQEVEGLYFPFSQSQGMVGQDGASVSIDKIVLNPEIDDSVFAFPENN